MNMTGNTRLTVTCTTECGEVDLEVEGHLEPFVPAHLSGRPEDCYPSEGGTFDTLVVYLAGSDKVVETLPEDFPTDAELYELASR